MCLILFINEKSFWFSSPLKIEKMMFEMYNGKNPKWKGMGEKNQ